jgi:hypothetical protein
LIKVLIKIPRVMATQSQQEVSRMKKLWILLIVAMFGLVLACGSKEEKKAPAKAAAPPVKAEKVVPPAAPATPPPAAAPSTPAPANPAQPKAEHPK